jgi:hypothetical protein
MIMNFGDSIFAGTVPISQKYSISWFHQIDIGIGGPAYFSCIDQGKGLGL